MWTVHFEYDVMGRESLRRLLGGVESRTRYDRSGHVTDRVTQGVSYEVSHRSYDWDLSGKLYGRVRLRCRRYAGGYSIQRGAKGRLYAASHTEHKWH